MKHARLQSIVAGVLLLVGVGVAAQRFPLGAGGPGDMRARWESMTETERERMRTRFAELEKLAPEERQRLMRRAERLDQMARTVYRSLDEEERVELDAVPGEQRRALLRDMAVAEAREMGQRILSKLPEADRERLESATEEDRLHFFLEFEKRQARRLDEAIDRYAADFLTRNELARLKAMSPMEQRHKFLVIVKRKALTRMEQGAVRIPPAMAERYHERMKDLEPPEFWMALERLKRKHGSFIGARPAHNDDAALLRRAVDMMDVSLEDRLRLASLTPPERLQVKRERAMTVLRERDMAEPAELERLDGLDNEAFFLEVRAICTGRVPLRPGLRNGSQRPQQGEGRQTPRRGPGGRKP